MSQENVEIVRSLFEASNRSDVRAGAKLMDEGVVFDARGMELENEDFARVYFGPEGVRDFWRAWLPAWIDMQVEIRWIREVGDRVIVWLHQRQIGRVSEIPVEFYVAWDFLFRDGKIVRMAFFRDERKALEAVGLSEQDA
jgi:ketosteroid isomerase-like protein